MIKRRTGYSWIQISNKLKVSGRVLRNWRAGDYLIPLQFCKRAEAKFGVGLPKNIETRRDFWNASRAAKKGALRRLELYGPPGTPEGRRKGGLNSIKSRRLKGTSFIFVRPIQTPPYSERLAELFGILIGDGGITPFQVRVTVDKKTDKEYSKYVKELFEELFGVRASAYELDNRPTIDIVVSRKLLVTYLNQRGLPIGNKIRQEIDIPDWIKAETKFSIACLRGLFDTDGSVYIDRHHYKGNTYENINLAITSASGKLLYSIYEILANLGLTPTISSHRSVRIRKSEQVLDFFGKIGSNNPKHLDKFKMFFGMERYPSGRTGAVSKTAWV